VSRVNVSLDTLDRDCMKGITGRDCLPSVLAGLQAAKAAGLAPIKINMVAMRGVNDAEIDAVAAFCIEQQFVLRLIEVMPMGETGRNTSYLNLGPVQERLARRFDLRPQALELGGGPALLEHADGSASDRLYHAHVAAFLRHLQPGAAVGRWHALPVSGAGAAISAAPLLRGGASDAELEAAIRAAIELKPHSMISAASRKIIRFMSQTGG
jgi:cyclic pyranopterin phosphate synthase